MRSDTRLGRRAVRLMIAAVMVGVGVAALLLNVSFGKGDSGPFAGEPLPRLFPEGRLPAAEHLSAPAVARARRAIKPWLRSHAGGNDGAFTAWALRAMPSPPKGVAQRHELAVLHRIDAHRTRAGIDASLWLEAHGKKDVWKLYLKQYDQLVDKPAAKRAKKLFKQTYKLASAIEAKAKPHFARVSPYITDPSLHAINQQRFTRKFCYPSKHTVLSYALTTVLSRLEPHRLAEYRWMDDEISYSRLYAGGHYPSDISAGAYLGTLVGEYELAHAA